LKRHPLACQESVTSGSFERSTGRSREKCNGNSDNPETP
jgi:hypothetical protein